MPAMRWRISGKSPEELIREFEEKAKEQQQQ
jgi:hypothetical protein